MDEESRRVQAHLVVGAAGDVFEGEADRVADQVARMPDPLTSEAGSPADRPRLRRYFETARGGGQADVALQPGGGRPLSPQTRAFMEPRFGVDFGHVRLHTGPAAEAAADRLWARAFTYGHDIWLGRGAVEQDRRLMAHELTHVVQQRGTAPARIARQSFHASCSGREEVLRAAWEEGERLTLETIDTLESILTLARVPGGALRHHPRAADILQNTFGEVDGLAGLEPGQVGFTNLPRIIERFRRIAAGFAAGKDLRCDPETINEGNECDWRSAFVVVGNRNDIFLCPNFFQDAGDARTIVRGATLLHEMAHLELRASHAGLPERTFPPAFFDCGEPLGLSFDDALRNAFAYDVLANCLHGTRPSSVITVERGGAEAGAAGVPERRFAVSGSAGGRLLDDGRHFASIIGARYSLRAGEVVVFNPVIGLNVLHVPGTEVEPAHLAAAVADVGIRIQQPVEGLYLDAIGGAFVGFEAAPGEAARFTGGLGAALGAGWRWDRLELGVEARGLLPLQDLPALDRGSLLILGRSALRF